MQSDATEWTDIDLRDEIWSRVFTVNSLVVVGTREKNGEMDFAPKHMATPLGPGRYFGFVCTPRHNTYANVERTRCFSVTYLKPDQIVEASLAASPRYHTGKPMLEALDTAPAEAIDGELLAAGALLLECELDRIVTGFDEHALIVGRIVHARAEVASYRSHEVDDADALCDQPLLAYVHPGRWAKIDRTDAFPFPWGFER